MIAISATSQNWEKNKIGKTCCQQVRSFLVRFVSFFVRFVIFLVGFSISLSFAIYSVRRRCSSSSTALYLYWK
jgi:hypothetical protein